MSFMTRLVDAEDRTADAAIVAALWSLAAFFGIAGYSVWKSPDHHADLMGLGTGAGAIIAAIGTAGWLRGRRQDQPASGA
jgi:hypothetical protein